MVTSGMESHGWPFVTALRTNTADANNESKNLEETGMSYQLEVDMIRKARQMGLLTTPYVFNVEEAKLMTEVQAHLAEKK